MGFRCVHCGEPAEYIFKGSSFCEQHFIESTERAAKETSKSDLERILDAKSWAREMVKEVEAAENIGREAEKIVEEKIKEIEKGGEPECQN